jgi:hypothetical protein
MYQPLMKSIGRKSKTAISKPAVPITTLFITNFARTGTEPKTPLQEGCNQMSELCLDTA